MLLTARRFFFPVLGEVDAGPPRALSKSCPTRRGEAVSHLVVSLRIELGGQKLVNPSAKRSKHRFRPTLIVPQTSRPSSTLKGERDADFDAALGERPSKLSKRSTESWNGPPQG